ncbi:small integral membrane protein 7 isoform X2 [Heliangelus exortis]|uniref:small integral membrane protein 7 isoform X2 n=1 Tax=Heliangelus exortis TaxID=472823 RepID=UPI003A943AEE
MSRLCLRKQHGSDTAPPRQPPCHSPPFQRRFPPSALPRPLTDGAIAGTGGQGRGGRAHLDAAGERRGRAQLQAEEERHGGIRRGVEGAHDR